MYILRKSHTAGVKRETVLEQVSATFQMVVSVAAQKKKTESERRTVILNNVSHVCGLFFFIVLFLEQTLQ